MCICSVYVLSLLFLKVVVLIQMRWYLKVSYSLLDFPGHIVHDLKIELNEFCITQIETVQHCITLFIIT